MRLPRMTTRRWMVAVAVVALLLGGSQYSVGLKRTRDHRLARAAWHSAREAAALRSLAVVPARFDRLDAAPEPKTSYEPAWAIDRILDVPIEGRGRWEAGDRVREVEEVKKRAIAPRRRTILAEFRRRESERLRKQADYHAALARKYRRAASRPWSAVAPDPPEPK